jgi:hypothetical protein
MIQDVDACCVADINDKIQDGTDVNFRYCSLQLVAEGLVNHGVQHELAFCLGV